MKSNSEIKNIVATVLTQGTVSFNWLSERIDSDFIAMPPLAVGQKKKNI